MNFTKIQLYYNTLKYLRWKQIAYRFFYFVRNKWRKTIGFSYTAQDVWETFKVSQTWRLSSIQTPTSYTPKNTFTFLNKTQKFDTHIDWEFADYGKLWTYNLTYFDFLNQKEGNSSGGLVITRSCEERSKAILSDFHAILNDFIQKQPNLKNANEPFPISLRGINWIKYFIQNKIQNPDYDRSLFHQYQILADNIEYHLLGNHLLENGFSLLFGGVYFQNAAFFNLGYKILTEELEEQILEDGAHFELCPMYHKIMLFRVLDAYNLLKNNPLLDFDDNKSKNNTLLMSVASSRLVVTVSKEKVFELTQLLRDKAVLMLGWLETMTYKDGSTPHFGDSTDGIAPISFELFDYAQRLNISYKKSPLSTSGFRKLKNDNFELTAKVGAIGPDYIPGHAHADSLSFELRNFNKPFLIDMGISTYETNDRRQQERNTSSHNTVEINGQNSSEVWGSFRVGNRAKTTILKDTSTELWAFHDGYKKMGFKHERQFVLTENVLEIIDKTDEKAESKAFFHFHPDVQVTINNGIVQFNGGEINFFMTEKYNLLKKNIELADYLYPTGYNTFLKATKIIITFNGTLKTQINKA